MGIEDAQRVLSELAFAADRGIALEDTELTTNEVYGALLWAMDENADLREVIDQFPEDLAAISDGIEAFLEQPFTEAYDPFAPDAGLLFA